MEKDKVVLKDGTVLEIEQSSGTGEFTMVFPDMAALTGVVQKLASSNLEAYQVQNQDGLTVARPENKECLHVGVDLTWNQDGSIAGVSASFRITDVDMAAKRLAALEDTVQVHDGAIGDLGAVVDAVAAVQDQQGGV